NRVATIGIPNPDWYGSETITFRATDPGGLWDEDSATFTVTNVNDPPVAYDDSYSVNEGGTLNVVAPGVLGNDLDVDGDPLTAVLDEGPSNASSFTLNSNGSFIYIHDGSASTSDSFTYHANDGTANSNIATVTITINPVNDPPEAEDDYETVIEDSSNNQIDVLANDTDPDGDDLEITDVTTPSHGTATTDGDYVYYTPDSDYCGNDEFEYTVDDGHGGTDIANVYITVTCVNDPPTTPSITGKTNGQAGKPYDYNFTAIDPDGDQVKYFIDWGDGNTEWTSLAASGTTVTISHTWAKKDTYTITAYAQDEHGLNGPNGTLVISMPLLQTVPKAIQHITSEVYNNQQSVYTTNLPDIDPIDARSSTHCIRNSRNVREIIDFILRILRGEYSDMQIFKGLKI
ncbi:MAG: tandem-95 repeat protein, partial [Thermoplasmatales archaeon]